MLTATAGTNGQMMICKCMQVQIYFTTTSSSTIAYDFNEQLKKVRNWHATFVYGREPVPQVYREAFKDGELDL